MNRPGLTKKFDLGEGFTTKTRTKEVLEKHDLIGKDVLGFVNELCFIVDEKKEELPLEEWESMEFSLRALMVSYDGGELYYYLLHAHGAEALNYNAWAHFASDTDWLVCVRTFTYMPTAVLEEYAAKDGQNAAELRGKRERKKSSRLSANALIFTVPILTNRYGGRHSFQKLKILIVRGGTNSGSAPHLFC